MYQINWTQPAIDTLAILREYLTNHSSQTTDNFLLRLLDIAFTLNLAPERGRLVFETDHRRDIRELLVDDFRIIYRLHAHQVDTLTVIRIRKHLNGLGAKHWKNKLKK